MTQDELTAMLRAHEWRDIEFKEARTGVPSGAYETVSAFANTEGGYIVFGVRKSGRGMEIVGVSSVDRVQNEFLTTVRQSGKISVAVDVREELHKYNGADLLVFHVPEVHRSQKPVFLNGDIRRAFVRSGGSNVRCSDSERDRFLMDAASERYDGQPVDLDARKAFDEETFRWYRAVYESRPENRSYAALSNIDFLNEMGLLTERKDGPLPTRAAILLFGANPAFRQLLPRPVVDCQRFAAPREAADTGLRWFDRFICEENLVRTWRSLIDDWYARFAEHPFRVDPATLQRDDTPPDYLAFRESMINLIVHQDYADHSRNAEIRHYADQTVFWNPGDAFAAGVDLLEPGEKEARNPRIVLAFRRIGLNENAGWGLRDVFRNWQQLGHVPPRVNGDKRRKSFEIVLQKEKLLSERQLAFQQGLGARLTNEQSRALAFACRETDVTLPQIKAVSGLSMHDAAALADSLTEQALLERAGPDGYVLAARLRERYAREAAPAHAAADSPAEKTGPAHAETAHVGPSTAHVSPSTAHVSPSTAHVSRSTAHVKPKISGSPEISKRKGKISTAHVKTAHVSPSSAHEGPLAELAPVEWRIVELCREPRSLTEIMNDLDIVHRSHFKKRRMDPLIRAGLVRMTEPDSPRAPRQMYLLTSAGALLLAAEPADAEEAEAAAENGASED